MAGLVRKPSSRRGEVGWLRSCGSGRRGKKPRGDPLQDGVAVFSDTGAGGFSRVFVGSSFFSEKPRTVLDFVGSNSWKEMGENRYRVFGSMSKN